MTPGINIAAVTTSALVGLGINFVWFTVLFRVPYIAALDRTREQLAAGPSILAATIIQFAGFVVMAGGLAWLMQRTGLATPAGGMMLASLTWAAFVAAIIGPMYAYQAFPPTLFAIVAGGYLVVLLACGAILGTWR